MTRPDPHASYREHVSSEAEAVEEDSTSRPRGRFIGEACTAMAEAVAENQSLRAQLATARKALEECRTAYCGFAITKNEQYPTVLASFWKELQRIDKIARAALNSGEQKQIEDWPYPEGNPTCAQDLK